MKKLAVVALGGNAILRDNQVGTIEEQEKNTADTLRNLLFLIRDGYNLIITHGNGPQVGNILMRNDAGEHLYGITQMPLDVCVADTQGGIGYIIERMLRNVLKENNMQKDILTIGAQVKVNEKDTAFSNPTKRVGKTYDRAESEKLAKEKGWEFKPEPKHPGGFRRVVPSPQPIDMFNIDTVEKIARSGAIVITSGGGGVPVYIDEEGMVRTCDAVIDKDLASSLLANRVNADEFYILTDVPYVYLNYNEPNQTVKEFLNLKDAREFYDKGMFGEGSMAPKVKAAMQFIERGGAKAIITEATKLEDRDFGTKITKEYAFDDLERERRHQHS
jgi:carbamate kinase